MPGGRAPWSTGPRAPEPRRPRRAPPARCPAASPGVAPRRAPPPARASAAGPDSALPGTRVPNRRAGRAAYSDGLVGGVAEGGTQLGERERLVEVGTPEGLEELQGVAPHGVARGEDDALGRARVVAREFLVHLASREVRHAKIADDDVEVARDGALQRGWDRKNTRPNCRHVS